MCWTWLHLHSSLTLPLTTEWRFQKKLITKITDYGQNGMGKMGELDRYNNSKKGYGRLISCNTVSSESI